MAQPTPDDDVVHDFKECLKLLLNGRDVLSQSCRPNTRIPPQKSGGSWRLHHFRLRGLQAFGGGGRCPDVAGPVEAKQNLIDPGFSLCSDPMFKRERGKYVGFIELLRWRHPCTFRDLAARRKNASFVWKKGRKKMRMILHCRRPNLWLQRPPHVQLLTGNAASASRSDNVSITRKFRGSMLCKSGLGAGMVSPPAGSPLVSNRWACRDLLSSARLERQGCPDGCSPNGQFGPFCGGLSRATRKTDDERDLVRDRSLARAERPLAGKRTLCNVAPYCARVSTASSSRRARLTSFNPFLRSALRSFNAWVWTSGRPAANSP